MKTKRILALSVLLCMAVFNFSCKSDDDGGSGGGAAAGTIVAKINGTNFTSAEMLSSAIQSPSGVMITGSTLDSPVKTITMTIFGYNGVGTYPIGGDSNVSNVGVYSESTTSGQNTWHAPYDDNMVGEIKVSEVTSTYIKGTFHFKAKNDPGDGSIKDITEGSFNVKFQTAVP